MKQNIAKKTLYWDSVQCDNEIRETILVNDNYQEAIGRLRLGEYKALNLEKLHNYDNIYSIRVKGKDKSDRLLFTYREGEKEALILSLVDNHDYKTALKEANNKIVKLDDLQFVDAANEEYHIIPNHNDRSDIPEFRQLVDYNKHLITLSDQQSSVSLPIIINGIAGSGKTLVAQNLLMSAQDEENVISYYFAPTDKLVETMTKSIQDLPQGKSLIAEGKIIATTFENYAQTQLEQYDVHHQASPKKVVGLDAFKAWYHDPKKLNSISFKSNELKGSSLEQIYSEICIASTYQRVDYKSLGKKESLFANNKSSSNKAFNLMESYLRELEVGNLFDPNLMTMPAPVQLKQVGIERFDNWFNHYQSLKAIDGKERNLEALASSQNMYALLSSARMNEEDATVISQEDKDYFAELSEDSQKTIIKIRKDYLQDLKDENLQDPTLMRLIPQKKRVVVDEFQSASLRLLKTAQDLSEDNAVMYAGDIAQTTLTSISNIGAVKKLFNGKIEEDTWVSSYRCPSKVIGAASELLRLKQAWTHEKQTAKPANDMTEERKGQCYFYSGEREVNDIANIIKAKTSADTFIIVPDINIRAEAITKFQTGLVVTPQEFIGMESPHVVMYRCFEKKAPKHLIQQTQPAEESDKTSINELFIAMTRELLSLTICEKKPHNHDLFQALDLERLNRTSQGEKPAVKTFGDLSSNNEEQLIDRVKEFIAKGKEGEVVAYNILLQNIYQGNEVKAKAHLSELKGEKFSAQMQEPKQQISEEKNIKVNEAFQKRKTRNNKAVTLEPIMVDPASNGSHQEIAKKIQNRQNNKGWRTSRVAQAMVAFLAIMAGKYVSGIFKEDKEAFLNQAQLGDLRLGVDDPVDILKKIDCTKQQDFCKHALYHAAKGATAYDLNLLKVFGESGVDLNQPLSSTQESAAHIAAATGNIEVLKLLKDYADLGLLNNADQTPAYYAASNNNPEILKLLIDLGYDIEYGRPFHNAVRLSCKETIHLMKDYVDLDLFDHTGYAAIHLAIDRNNSDLLKLLIEAGADLNIQGINGVTAAHVAAHNDYSELLEMLKSNGANFYVPNDKGNIPLHIAAQRGNLESLKVLLDNQNDLLIENKKGRNPMIFAYNSQQAEIIDFIGKLGFSVQEELEEKTLSPTKTPVPSSHSNQLSNDKVDIVMR